MANRYWGRRWNVFSIDKGRLEEVSVLAGATLDMYSEDTSIMIDLVIFENSLHTTQSMEHFILIFSHQIWYQWIVWITCMTGVYCFSYIFINE
jgi:hypothetical protein